MHVLCLHINVNLYEFAHKGRSNTGNQVGTPVIIGSAVGGVVLLMLILIMIVVVVVLVTKQQNHLHEMSPGKFQ